MARQSTSWSGLEHIKNETATSMMQRNVRGRCQTRQTKGGKLFQRGTATTRCCLKIGIVKLEVRLISYKLDGSVTDAGHYEFGK